MDMALRPNHRGIVGAILVSLLSFNSSCKSSPHQSVNTSTSTSPNVIKVTFDKRILGDFADKVVIPTNQLFAVKAKELFQAVDTLDEKTLRDAQNAWIAARSSWERR